MFRYGKNLTALLVYPPAGSDNYLGLAQEGSKNGLIRVMDRGSLPGLSCCCYACLCYFFTTYEDEPPNSQTA